MVTAHAFVARLALLALLLCAFGCGDDASSMLPPGIAPGVYHLHFERAVDLVGNLELDPNGTFRWGGGGFDSPYEGDGGRWRASNGRLVLAPTGKATSFVWPIFLADSGSFPQDVYEQLEVVAGSLEGELIISGVGERFGFVSASWRAGGTCLEYDMGTWFSAPCEDPYLGSCDESRPYCPAEPSP